jgi:hypothetical protein
MEVLFSVLNCSIQCSGILFVVLNYFVVTVLPESVLPSASLVLENIGFVYVYDCNRPFTSILKQRRCSLMYDVY